MKRYRLKPCIKNALQGIGVFLIMMLVMIIGSDDFVDWLFM